MRVALNGLFLDAPATGTGQYLRELVTAMRVVAPKVGLTFIAPHADESAPAPVTVAATAAKRANFAKIEFEQVTFPRASKRGKFDLAHVPHFGPPLFPSLPTVVTIHDLIPMVLPAYQGSARVRLYTALAGHGAQRAKAVIADSHASARDIEAHLHISRERIHVVHLAADGRYHPPENQGDIDRVRAKYHLPERFVLYLGGFDVRKNVGRIIETFAALSPEERAGYRMVLAGKLPERNSDFFPEPRLIAERHSVLEQIDCIGFVDEGDKPALYAAARVFLFASQYEGFGLPPLEAMACGTPVISANTSSLPEVVGEGGILLNPDDSSSWNRELGRLLWNGTHWNRMRAMGLEQAARFSWARAAKETLSVYRGVV